MKKPILILTLLLLLALIIIPATAQTADGEDYTVQAGDWLSKIAEKYYDNALAYPAIVDATNAKAAEDDSYGVINNPDVIEVGQKLWIPAQADSVAAAPAASGNADAVGDASTSVAELTAVPVQWVSFTDPTQQFDIATPENYTIAFNPDGTVNVKADCNDANGTYVADDSGSLSIEIGPMTKAMCPKGSHSDQFVQNLGFVSNFFWQGGYLYLDMMADGGTLKMAPGSEHMPAGEATTETTAAAFGDAWESVACDTFGVAPDVAEIADCGYVTVPENRAAGTDATIQLAVVRLPSTSDNPGAPLFKGTGGPGSNGLLYATASGIMTAETYDRILADRDWVFFSQRGTENAIPDLYCPEYTYVPRDAAVNGWSTEEVTTQKIETLQACYDDFVAQGVDFSGYNSNENAADVNDIRQVMGYDKIVWYGQSYGTMLGQFIMRNHPEILESVILDGVVPISLEKWTDLNEYPDGFQRVFDACAADEACNANYPDPAGALAEAYATLQENPQPVTIQLENGEEATVMVNGDMMMGTLYRSRQVVPKTAYQLQAGDYSVLNTSIPESLTPGGPRRLMHYAVACADDPTWSMDDINTDVPDMYKFMMFNDGDNYVAACPVMNVPQLPATSDELIVSDIPTLLLNGGLDEATPAHFARETESGLSNSYYVMFPGEGHVQEQTPCALDIMDAFMTNPYEAPDVSCIDPKVHFEVPLRAVASSEDGSATIEVTLPAGTFQAVDGQEQLWMVTDSTALLGLQAAPAGTTPEALLNEYVATLPDSVGEVEIIDGFPIAGYPTKAIQLTLETEGGTLGLDALAFENEAGTYRIVWQTNVADLIEPYRQMLPAIVLADVTVTE